MIRVANCKMQLEHVVIETGQFKQEHYAPENKLEVPITSHMLLIVVFTFFNLYVLVRVWNTSMINWRELLAWHFFHVQEYDLLALLRHDRDIKEDCIQSSEISDADLLRALDRTDLCSGRNVHVPIPRIVFPTKGPGWEVVTKMDYSRNILTSIKAYRKQSFGKKMEWYRFLRCSSCGY